jgi:hypothetical protein
MDLEGIVASIVSGTRHSQPTRGWHRGDLACAEVKNA